MSDLYLLILGHEHFPLLFNRDAQLAAYVAGRIADDLEISPGQVIDAALSYTERLRHTTP